MKTVLLLLGISSLAAPIAAREGRYLTYDDFVRQVEAGNIQSVTLDKFSTITGIQVVDGTTNSFQSHGDTGSANDPLLAQLLKEHGVALSIRDRSDPNFTIPILSSILFMGTPIAILVFLIVITIKLNKVLANQRSHQPTPGPYPGEAVDGRPAKTQE